MSHEERKTGLLSNVKSGAFSKVGLIAIGSFVFVILLGGGGGYVWAQQYDGRIGPNVFVASVDVSGMDPETAREILQERVDNILTQGLSVSLAGDVQTLPLLTYVSDDILNDVEIDVDGAIQKAVAASNREDVLSDTMHIARGLLRRTDIYPDVAVNEDAILTSLRRMYPEAETFAQNAGFEAASNAGTWTISVTDAVDGKEFNPHIFVASVTFPLVHLIDEMDEPIQVETTLVQAPVQRTDAEALVDAVDAILERAPFELSHEEPGRTRTWGLTQSQIANMIAAERNDDGVFLTLTGDAFEAYLDQIEEDVNIEPRNAKFEIIDGKVKEFVGSIPGQHLDRPATLLAIDSTFAREDTDIAIVVTQTTPEIATGDVNDLGISELLGAGISDYSNSPANRISNIRNAVRILNGTLIAPGETFSLVKALAPFNYANGYLPELVIKGDKIEPEMGGGACQIGTTTFRATMNSGLPIVERRNHSLVVNHYNDPSNGNPGTDATIYEVNGVGSPDYKFLNDTGHYILFQAEMLTQTEELRFSFWGTSDGRKGSYSPPVVHRWIGAGPKQEIETADMAPGTRKCQNSFAGADASFTYTVVHADGTVEERVFESHYRALPSICLVGPEVEEETISEEAEEEGTDAEVDVNLPDDETSLPEETPPEETTDNTVDETQDASM